jgi:hypothetical protein
MKARPIDIQRAADLLQGIGDPPINLGGVVGRDRRREVHRQSIERLTGRSLRGARWISHGPERMEHTVCQRFQQT